MYKLIAKNLKKYITLISQVETEQRDYSTYDAYAN